MHPDGLRVLAQAVEILERYNADVAVTAIHEAIGHEMLYPTTQPR